MDSMDIAYMLRVVKNMGLFVGNVYSRQLFLLPLHSLCVAMRFSDAVHGTYKHYLIIILDTYESIRNRFHFNSRFV